MPRAVSSLTAVMVVRHRCPTRALLDDLADALGGLADDVFDDAQVAQRPAGLEGVGDVVLKAVFRVEHGGDAPLGVGAVGL